MVATEARKVHLESKDGTYEATGEIVSSQTISSKTRTVETITVCFKIVKLVTQQELTISHCSQLLCYIVSGMNVVFSIKRNVMVLWRQGWNRK